MTCKFMLSSRFSLWQRRRKISQREQLDWLVFHILLKHSVTDSAASLIAPGKHRFIWNQFKCIQLKNKI